MLGAFLLVAFVPLVNLPTIAQASNPQANGRLLERTDHNAEQVLSSRGSWLGWGANVYNNRWAASDAKIDCSNLASLHPVCRLQYTPGETAPPLVVHGVAYFPTWNGLLVALDYAKCKVLWQTNVTEFILQHGPTNKTYLSVVKPVSRTTPALYKNYLIIGTQLKALLLAIDKNNGKVVDTFQISTHPLAIITMSPTVWRGRIFIGSSSSEETGADVIPGYVCCSFIAAMNGLTFKNNHFHLLWSQQMIPADSNFSGAAIWGSQPSIDPKRNQVFIATGNVYTVPESYDACVNATANATSNNPGNATDRCLPKDVYQEALLAFNTVTGHINWSHRLSPFDAWNVACVSGFPGGGQNPGACPDSPGPDADFGMAPTFVPGSKYTPHKQDILVIGQKNGNLYALAASDGTLFWAQATSPDGRIGGLIWGTAVDATAAYYTAVNFDRKPWKLQDGTKLSNAAFGAASLLDGKILWETPVPRNGTSMVQPTVVNDIVFTGLGGPYTGEFTPTPGSFIALDKYTGVILEEQILDSFFQAGIAVVHDYVMFGTGYQQTPNGSFNVWQLKK